MTSRRLSRMLLLVVGLLVVLSLGACGQAEEAAPQLAALPTRTSVPATMTSEPGAITTVTVEFVSVQEAVRAYLEDAADTNPAYLLDVLDQHVVTPYEDCLTGSLFPDADPFELFRINPVTVDNEAWLESVDSFPGELLEVAIEEAFNEAAAMVPPVRSLRVCLIPAPPPNRMRGQDSAPAGGLSTTTLSADLFLVTCSAGEACLEDVRDQLSVAYASAYQVGVLGWNHSETTLLEKAMWWARAADFARLMTGVEPPWAGALTPAQEAAVWELAAENRDATYHDYPGGRRIDDILFGGRPATRYPDWGGLFIADKIVTGYRARHAAVTLAEYLAMPAADVLAGSGYQPPDVPDPTVTPTPRPTATRDPNATEVPTATLGPTRTPFPTPDIPLLFSSPTPPQGASSE